MKLRVRLFDPETVTNRFETIQIDSVLHKTAFNHVILVTWNEEENGMYDAVRVFDHTIFRGKIGDKSILLKAVSALDVYEYNIIPLSVEMDDKTLYTDATHQPYQLVDLDLALKESRDQRLDDLIKSWKEVFSTNNVWTEFSEEDKK
ncbi:MAG: hypothetical protein ACRC5A_10960 [Enterobacteriaceae bacterium]